MKYRINEIFYSLQGEGRNTGKAAVFIRFSGCNLTCPFCDTEHRLFNEYSAEEIVKKIFSLIPAVDNDIFIVLTGGEPALQVDQDLINVLRSFTVKRRIYIAIETNGTFPIKISGIDFITVSPKADFVKQSVIIKRANEVKVIFDGKHDPEKWLSIKAEEYYLQPCDMGDIEKNQEIISKLVPYVLKHPWWKISLQEQKILGIR